MSTEMDIFDANLLWCMLNIVSVQISLLGSTQQVIQVNLFPFQGNHLDLLVSSHLVFTINDSVSGVRGIT